MIEHWSSIDDRDWTSMIGFSAWKRGIQLTNNIAAAFQVVQLYERAVDISILVWIVSRLLVWGPFLFLCTVFLQAAGKRWGSWRQLENIKWAAFKILDFPRSWDNWILRVSWVSKSKCIIYRATCAQKARDEKCWVIFVESGVHRWNWPETKTGTPERVLLEQGRRQQVHVKQTQIMKMMW